MEALLIEYAKRYGIDKAMEILGLNKQTQNPKYAISLAGRSINPLNMLARAGINQVFSGSGIGGLLGPGLLLGGAAMLGNAFNPLNPNSKNFNPYLGGQIDYLGGKDNFIGTNPNTGLAVYGPGSVLAGKNVISMFGSNNYETALDNKIDYFENRISKGKPYNKERYEQAKKEKKDFLHNEMMRELEEEEKARNRKNYSPPYQNQIHSDGGSSGSFDTSGSEPMGDFSPQSDKGRQDYGRGGIASL